MIKLKLITRILAMGIAMHSGARGDSIVLKNGERIKGRITKETPTEITILVNVTSTIRDDLVIKRSEVKAIEKLPPDLEAWAPLAGMSLAQQSLEVEDYDNAIESLNGFIERHPDSGYADEARKKIEKFQAEQKRVEAGDLKLDGRWYSKTQIESERVQIGGMIAFNRMKRLALNGQPVEAISVFEAMEKEFAGSAVFPEAVLLARRTLPTIIPLVQHRIAQIKRRDEQNQQRLKYAKKQVDDEIAGAAASEAARAAQRSPGKPPRPTVATAVPATDSEMSPKQHEYAQLVVLLKREKSAADDAVVALEKSGTKWIPIHVLNEAAGKSLMTKVTAEITRLQALPVEKMKSSLAAAGTVAAALASHDLESAEKALTAAKTAWAANELLNRLGVKVAEAKTAAGLTKGTGQK